jgi:hypothetical protein
MKNDDPILAAIEAHARAFASRAHPSQDWNEIHSSAEGLLGGDAVKRRGRHCRGVALCRS